MRLVKSENPSFPPLDPLPSEMSWALEAERDGETARLHSDRKPSCRKVESKSARDWRESNRSSAKWPDSGSRNVSYRGGERGMEDLSKKGSLSHTRPCETLTSADKGIALNDDLWGRSGSLLEDSRQERYAPSSRCYAPRGHRRFAEIVVTEEESDDLHKTSHSHVHPQSRDRMDQHEARSHIETRARDRMDQHEARSHIETRSRDRMDQRETKSYIGTKRSEREGGLRDLYVSKRHSRAYDNEKHGFGGVYSSKVEGKSRSKTFKEYREHGYGDKDRLASEKVDLREAQNQPRARLGCEKHGHGGYDKLEKKLGFAEHGYRNSHEKELGHEEHGYGKGQYKAGQNRTETRFELEEMRGQSAALSMQSGLEENKEVMDKDVAALESDLRESNTVAEGLNNSAQHNEISSEEGNLEMTCKDDQVVKRDDSLASKKQYEMLASLLLDDPLDIDQDFDLTLAPEGLKSEFCGSIFDEDLELPNSMDVDMFEGVKGEKTMLSGVGELIVTTRAVDLKNTKSTACGSTLEDGKMMMKNSVYSNKMLSKGFAMEDAAKKPPGKLGNMHASAGSKHTSPPVFVDVTNKFNIQAPSVVKQQVQEDDVHRLSQRQRQIEFGKNTLGYERYSELVPRSKRKRTDPQTPNPKQVCSKRSWDGQIRKWRRLLHAYDPPVEDGEEMAEDFSLSKSGQGHLKAEASVTEAEDNRPPHRSSQQSKENKMAKDLSLDIYEDWMES